MDRNYLDGSLFRNALKEMALKLYEKRTHLNRINVFLVPDGDTGSNMLATVESALWSARNIKTDSLCEVSDAVWAGALDGSAGNSGAIFTQYLKGWADSFYGLEQAGAETVLLAMTKGTEEAYGALLEPVEGTMLTVAREAAVAAEKALAGGSMNAMMTAAYAQARKALLKTRKMLPELKRKRIVDAGGWGLLIFFASLLKVMAIPLRAEFEWKVRADYFKRCADFSFEKPFDMEFAAKISADRQPALRSAVGEIGTNIITRANENEYYVHMHTHNPLMVVERVAELAEILDLTVRDMRSQYMDTVNKNDHGHHTIVFGKSPGFIAMYAMAGAQLAISMNRLGKKTRLLQEYARDALLISCKDIDLPFFENGVLVMEDEARVLASLTAVSAQERPADETVRKAAGHPRNLNVVKLGYSYEARTDGRTVAGGGLKETLANALAYLQPKDGEMLTVYYGRESGRQEMEALIPYLQDEIGNMEGVELFYGGQEFPLVISLV